MKAIILALFVAASSQTKIYQRVVPMDNPKEYWDNDYELYRSHRQDNDNNNCRIRESHNWLGAQQCKYSWECRGARTCERGGWCSGYDGCEGTPLPYQAPGLAPDCWADGSNNSRARPCVICLYIHRWTDCSSDTCEWAHALWITSHDALFKLMEFVFLPTTRFTYSHFYNFWIPFIRLFFILDLQ